MCQRSLIGVLVAYVPFPLSQIIKKEKKEGKKKINHDIGQSLNLAARDICSRDIFGHNANPVTLSYQTPKPSWKT